MKSMRLIAECVLVAMAVLCAVSCEKEENDNEVIIPGTEVNHEKVLSFSAWAVQETYEIVSSGKWSVSGTTDWCSVSLDYDGGKTLMVMRLTKNTSFCERRTHLTIELGENSYEILVRQAAGYNLHFDNKAASDTTSLSGNMIWNISGATEWCDVSLEYGEENTHLTVSVTDNPDREARYARLQFTSGRDTFYIPVSQKCVDYVQVCDETKELFFTAAAACDTVLIRSSEIWAVSGVPAWCGVSHHKGGDSVNFVVNIRENLDTLDRKALLTFTCGEARDTLVLHQQHPDYVIVRPDTIQLPAEEATGTLTIRSSGEWTATGGGDWCSLSATKGQNGDRPIITATKNESINDREAQFVLTCGEATDTLTVTQRGVFVTISPDSDIEAGNGTMSYELTVNSSADWSVAGATDWCMVSQTTGDDGDRLTISIVENETFAQRQTTLQFTCDAAHCLLVVTQAPKDDYIRFTPVSMNMHFDNLASNKSLTINSAREWRVAGMTDWCTISQDSGNDGDIITIAVSENGSDSQRATQLIFTSGVVADTIAVSQYDYLTIADSLRVHFGAKRYALPVSSAGGWRVAGVTDWCTVGAESGAVGDSLIVYVTKNADSAPRVATLTMTSGMAVKELVVRQNGKYLTEGNPVDLGLSVDWASYNMNATGRYFIWGGTSPDTTFGWISTPFLKQVDKYMKDVVLPSYIYGTEYDAAYVRWGSDWRMPTYYDMRELVKKCTWIYDEDDGGYYVVGPNENTIFFPAVGYAYSFSNHPTYYEKSPTCYWTGDKRSRYGAYILYFDKDGVSIGELDATYGASIRPVKKK
ncbi:MAG: BACON domain-containing protein [Coprobacter sp.]|nr:BACON domain-containing protein [Coprobacter sp.]